MHHKPLIKTSREMSMIPLSVCDGHSLEDSRSDRQTGESNSGHFDRDLFLSSLTRQLPTRVANSTRVLGSGTSGGGPPELDPPELEPPELEPPELEPPELDPPELDPPELEPPELDPPELDPPEL